MEIELEEKRKIKIRNPRDIFKIMREILLRENKIDQGKEHFWTVGLNGAGRLMYIELVSMGTYNETYAVPRDVFSIAVQKKATQVIGVHNHPDESLKFSRQDKKTTKTLIESGRILGIEFIDHIIITTESYTSFCEEGFMK